MNIVVSDDARIMGIHEREEIYWLPCGMNIQIIT